MAITTTSRLDFAQDYSEIRKKEVYEQVILNIMNDSKIVFPSTYEHIDKQDNAESDFIDINNNLFFDAKLLFQEKLCQALRRGKIEQFLEDISKYTTIDVIKQIEIGMQETPLYKEIETRVKKLKENELGILFMPFPVLNCSSSSAFVNLCSDEFDLCVYELNIKKDLYFIGVNIYGEVICKKYGKEKVVESLRDVYFGDYIKVNAIGWRKE